MKVSKSEREEAITVLREAFPPGSVVHVTLRHVSRSGMQRSIAVFGEGYRNLSYRVAQALGWGFDDKRDGVKVNGCGMDMGFHLVMSLSYVLHGHDEAKIPKLVKKAHRNTEKRPGYTLAAVWF